MMYSFIHRTQARLFTGAVMVAMLLSMLPIQAMVANAATSTLFSEDFETTPAYTSWDSSDPKWGTNNSDAHTGVRQAQVEGNTNGDATIVKTLDTTGHESIELSFWYRQDGLDDEDSLVVEWYDGSTWQEVVVFDGIDTDADDVVSWTEWSGGLPSGAEDNADFGIRFVADFSAGNGKFYLDDVNISGETLVPDSCDPQHNVGGPTDIQNTDTGEYFDTIQDSIDDCDTDDGDTIEVTAGTHTEDVSVNKELTVDGNNAATIEGQVRLLDSNIILTSFTIDGSATDESVLVFIPEAADGETNVAIQDNTIQNTDTTGASNSAGIEVAAGDNVTISGNTIQGISATNSDNKTGQGILIGDTGSGAPISNVLIENNVMTDITGAKGAYGMIVNRPVTNLDVIGNDISNITGNTDSAGSGWASGIGLDADTVDALIKNNVIDSVYADTDAYAAFGIIGQSTAAAESITVEYNDFLVDKAGENRTDGTVDYAYNWWGDDTGPVLEDTDAGTTTKNADGLGGTIYQTVSGGDVVIEPWLCGPFATDPDVSVDGACDDEPDDNGGQCIPESPAWADFVETASQGNQESGSPVLDARSDEGSVLGSPDSSFYSLGYGGSIAVGFNGYVTDIDGDDISIHETTNGNYPLETAKIEVSQDGLDWHELTEVARNDNAEGGDDGVTLLDFSETGLAWIQYVRVTDTTDAGLHNSSSDGFDLDAVDATQTVCEVPQQEQCSVTIYSDETNTVVEKGNAYAQALSFVHDAWTDAFDSAQWIWGDDPVDDPVVNVTQTFEKDFGWNGPVTDVTLEIASDNTYDASLNGTSVGDGVDVNNFSALETYTLATSTIDQGDNTFSVEVTNTEGSTNPAANPAGLLYKLTVTGTDAECATPVDPEPEGEGKIKIFKYIENWQEVPEPENEIDQLHYFNQFSYVINGASTSTFSVVPFAIETLPLGSYTITEGEIPDDYSHVKTICKEFGGGHNIHSYQEPGDYQFGQWPFDNSVSLDEDGDVAICVIVNEYNPDDDDEPTDPVACEINVNVLANGGFETPVVATNEGWNIFEDGVGGLGWSVDWFDNYSGRPDNGWLELHRGVNGWAASEGSQYAELDGDWDGPSGAINGEEASTIIAQKIPTVAGKTYTLSWDHSARPGTNLSENQLGVSVNGTELDDSSYDESGNGDSNTDWQSETYQFTGTGNDVEIAFWDDGAANSEGTFLDNVSLSCNPDTGYANYCGDGNVSGWEQCEPGDAGCTDYCLMENQCHTEQLVKITFDENVPTSESFDGKLYLGATDVMIPSGTWFNFSDLGDAMANHVADDVDGLAVQRDHSGPTSTLKLAFRGGNESQDIDYVQGDIEFLGFEPIDSDDLTDEINGTGYDLEEGGEGFPDVFDISPASAVFDMRADVGDDGVTLALTASEEGYGQCDIDGGGGNGGDDGYTLTIEVNPDNGASGVVEGIGINCGTGAGQDDCTETYATSTDVDITVSLGPDSTFDGSWTSGHDSCSGTSQNCTVTMDEDVDLVAHIGFNGGVGGSSGVTGGYFPSSSTSGGGIPQVAGAQTSVLPLGGANAGFGGATNETTGRYAWIVVVSMMIGAAVLRRTRSQHAR